MFDVLHVAHLAVSRTEQGAEEDEMQSPERMFDAACECLNVFKTDELDNAFVCGLHDARRGRSLQQMSDLPLADRSSNIIVCNITLSERNAHRSILH